MSALIDILRKGGGYWPRPPKGPGRALAVPNGARFRIVLPPEQPLERPSGGPGGSPVKTAARPLLRKARVPKPEPAPEPPVPITAGGVCRNGVFILDGGGAFDSAEQAARAAGAHGDPFACVEFLVGHRWMSADQLRRSDALPWDEADELALAIAAEAIRAKLKEDGELPGEVPSEPVVWRKAADAVATFPYFLDEARERLNWIKT